MSEDDLSDEVIQKLLADLTDRDKKVLQRRFGLDFLGGSNREIVSAMLEITQEKIGDIERKALKKLKQDKED